eukprot:723679-Prymnesium_polylepis.1
MQERATLEQLGGKRYFVKAWLEQEQLYLLCNVDGFVVSYLALGSQEVQALFERAKADAERAAAAAEAESAQQTNSSARTMMLARTTMLANQQQCTARRVQATWLSRMLSTASEAGTSGGDTPPQLSQTTSEVQISSLGDTDIIGLGSESTSYAHQSLEKQLEGVSVESSYTKKIVRQVRRLGIAGRIGTVGWSSQEQRKTVGVLNV